MSMLDQFEQVTSRFGRVAGYAIGGTAIIPLIGAFSGIAPPWPDGLSVISSVIILITLMLVFHLFTTTRRWVFSTVFLVSAALLVTCLGAYTYMRIEFVLFHPTAKESIILGCEWRTEALEVAKVHRIPTTDQCPGQFRDMLLDARDQYDIWTERSIRQVALLMACLWVGIFMSLSLTIGCFVIWYAKQAAPVEPTPNA
ncbi:hypothetical protein [Sphingomonas sp.]|uniref:hypothetical protein n=1 Tax=Sphingomonas sp. TaxID=28214 RepID=UPI003D6D34DB